MFILGRKNVFNVCKMCRTLILKSRQSARELVELESGGEWEIYIVFKFESWSHSLSKFMSGKSSMCAIRCGGELAAVRC